MKSLNTDLKAIFDAIENSASGYPSEKILKGYLLILILRATDWEIQ